MTYTPATNFNGTDSFTFYVTDGQAESSAATVTINVAAVNDAPVANSQVVIPTGQAQAVTLAASDVENNPLAYTIVAQPRHVALTGTVPNLTYTPTSGYLGTDSFTFKANDGLIDSNVATVTVAILLDNTSTGVTTTGTWTTSTSTSGYYGTNYIHDGNTDKGNRSVTYAPQIYAAGAYEVYVRYPSSTSFANNVPVDIVHSTGTSTVTVNQQANGGKWGLLGAYSLAAGTNGKVVIRTTGTTAYVIADAVLFLPQGSAPVAAVQSVTATKNTAKSITLSATDASGDSLTYSIVTNPAHGTLSGSGANRTYTPATDYTGSDSFTFKANDGLVDSNVATVTVNVVAQTLMTVQVFGESRSLPVGSFSGQDIGPSTVTVGNGGQTLNLVGNAWKMLDLSSLAIAANTVLEFDFSSSTQGEIHGVGFDTDLSETSGYVFKLYGTQVWGLSNYADYAASAPAVKHYCIPVGKHFTGTFRYLVFVNDHDVTSPTAQSSITNVRISAGLAVQVFGESRTLPVGSFGGQDIGPSTVTLGNAGQTLNLAGNTWKMLNLSSLAIASNTVLEFDFSSSVQGEIHGVGFDTDLGETSNYVFKLYGTQVWGVSNYADYAASAPAIKHYRIPVGQHYTGTFRYLVFVNDHDVTSPTAQSSIANVKILAE